MQSGIMGCDRVEFNFICIMDWVWCWYSQLIGYTYADVMIISLLNGSTSCYWILMETQNMVWERRIWDDERKFILITIA